MDAITNVGINIHGSTDAMIMFTANTFRDI